MFSIPEQGFPQQQSAEILPVDFSEMAFIHINYLSEMDHRQVGSENDRKTVQYIKDQFEKMHIDVEIQPFEFEAYEYVDLIFEVAGKQYDIAGLGIKPHNKKQKYEGELIPVDLNSAGAQYTQEEIEGKTIITDNLPLHFRLVRFKPELIIYVDSSVFQELNSQKGLNFNLHFKGGYKKYNSANIIGKVAYRKSSSKEVLITAHHDTFGKNNPGASDNASGVGVVLELARYFKMIEDDLQCTVKFVLFGGEEVGFLGSRIYINNNIESLRNCKMVFNIDNVGGERAAYIEITGCVDGISKVKGVSQIPENVKDCSWEGLNSKWRPLLSNDVMSVFSAANHPQWLVNVVNKTIADLGYDINPTQTMGSDALIFAQAGIVSSGIGIRSDHSHTPLDTPQKIKKTNLKIAGEIAAHVVLNVIKRN